jgi:rRNA-processing protein FCF1
MDDNIAEIDVAEKQTDTEQLEQDFELGKNLSRLLQKNPIIDNAVRQQLEETKEKYSQMEDLTEEQKEKFINKARAQFNETVDQVVYNNNEGDDEELPEEFNRLMGVIYRCDTQGTIKRIEDYLNAAPGVKPLAGSK